MFNYKEVRRLNNELTEANSKINQYVNLLDQLFNRGVVVDGVAIPANFSGYYDNRREFLRGVLAFVSALKANTPPVKSGKTA